MARSTDFKLATMSMRGGTLWMGDLEPYMDETFLKQAFTLMGENLVHAKVIKNRYTGLPMGYGFLDFGEEQTAQRVLHRCNGKTIPNASPPKRFKLNHASYGKEHLQQAFTSTVPGQDYSAYYQYQTAAYDYQSYYAAWQGYQQQQQAAAAAQQQQQPQQQQQQQPAQQYYYTYDQSLYAAYTDPQYQQHFQQFYESYEDANNMVEEHEIPIDVEQLNEAAVYRNEECFEALDSSRWLPSEALDISLVPVK
ncbi:tRNA selenocysteine 1-associated protein 1-like [Centruroides vittatus]|uniref:tRNA selenocysteine 1-associated protein 1-like n=1 Tax=Centruroides vittatus TaxID=120091 RepID=UPI00350FEE5D